MASKRQICMKTRWLGSTKSLWKLHTAPSYPRRTPN
jgi:hypothetical protein